MVGGIIVVTTWYFLSSVDRSPLLPVDGLLRPPLRDSQKPTPMSLNDPPSSHTGPKVIDVDVHPSTALSYPPSSPDPSERFLAYSPHSGYHNQRISLENALTLSFILGRTLLLPPVWLGHAIPYISTQKLQRRIRMASKDGLDRCKEFAEGGSEDPIPRECEGYFDWSLVHWDFMVDLSEAKDLVEVKDRWNHTEKWLEEELELAPHDRTGASPDVFYLNDESLYQYRYYDSIKDNEPLAKFANRVDLSQLKEESEDFKLLHVGSLFGTSRIHMQNDQNFDARSTFRRSMVFKNPLLDEITNEIRDRLGGSGNYYGLHLRVGDGVFQSSAPENMAGVWKSLCETKMKMPIDVCEELASASLKKHGRSPPLVRREDVPALPLLSSPATPEDDSAPPPPSQLVKRANSRPQRDGAYNHAALPPLSSVTSRSSSPLSRTLSCRSPLHTLTHLIPFNTPLFIATDSKVPTADRNLALFFDAFPCTFVLSDFGGISSINEEPVEGLGKLAGLRNREDKVPLAQFLYPQLDAQIAAYGRGLLGTPQSTYSRFAIDVLYQYYQ